MLLSLQYISVPIFTVSKVLLATASGAIAASYFTYPEYSNAGMSTARVKVFLPAKLFAQMANELDLEKLSEGYGWAVILCLLPLFLGYALGQFFKRFIKETEYHGLFLLSTTFQNVISYGMGVTQSLRGPAWIDAAAYKDFPSVIFLWNLPHTFAVWSIGMNMVRNGKKEEIQRQYETDVAAFYAEKKRRELARLEAEEEEREERKFHYALMNDGPDDYERASSFGMRSSSPSSTPAPRSPALSSSQSKRVGWPRKQTLMVESPRNKELACSDACNLKNAKMLTTTQSISVISTEKQARIAKENKAKMLGSSQGTPTTAPTSVRDFAASTMDNSMSTSHPPPISPTVRTAENCIHTAAKELGAHRPAEGAKRRPHRRPRGEGSPASSSSSPNPHRRRERRRGHDGANSSRVDVAGPADSNLAVHSTTHTHITYEPELVHPTKPILPPTKHGFAAVWEFIMECVTNITIMSTVVGLVIGLLPPLQYVAQETFIGQSTVGAITILGRLNLPMTLMQLGTGLIVAQKKPTKRIISVKETILDRETMTLKTIEKEKELPYRGWIVEFFKGLEIPYSFVLLVALIRLVIVPGVFLITLSFLKWCGDIPILGPIPTKKSFQIVVLIASCAPTDINCSSLCAMYKYKTVPYSQALLLIYVISIFTTAIWISCYLYALDD